VIYPNQKQPTNFFEEAKITVGVVVRRQRFFMNLYTRLCQWKKMKPMTGKFEAVRN
jgi:hypothetical protein